MIEGRHFAADSGEHIRLFVADGYITRIERMPAEGEYALHLPWIGPGLVDLQLNGHAGLDFNSHPLPPGRVIELTRLMWKEGVTSYMPTLVTNDPGRTESAAAAIAEACRLDEQTERTIAGIHLEGPFLSPEDGARGAHPREFVIAPDWDLFRRLQKAADGRIRLLTLSPEWPEAPDFIRRCADSGVVVSIGHTAASSEQIAAAVAAGATMSTHLGNGAHPMLPRHPNYLWEQLAHDELYGCVIADGFHVPSAFLKVVHRMKRDRFVLVSDAVLYSGMAPGEYDNPVAGEVVLTSEGRLHLKRDARLLAGSAQMLTHGISNLVREGICTTAEAWVSASTAPAAAMRLPVSAGLVPGVPADIAVFDRTDDGGIRIRASYKHGVKVYEGESE
ncbi:amidohydrolase family protein [Paenibacillus mesophilus]|nr:amidohydrolase family protein [Paenibacillus mesophilus]